MSLRPVYAVFYPHLNAYEPRSQAAKTKDMPKLWVVRAEAEKIAARKVEGGTNAVVVAFDLVPQKAGAQ